MIIVKLKGGLGNQMFQYATARGIVNGKHKPFLDLNFLNSQNKNSNKFTARSFELGVFADARVRILNSFFSNVIYSNNLFYKVIRKLFYYRVEHIRQNENEFIPGLLNFTRNIYLEGYFNSEKYFKHIREQLLKEFSFQSLDVRNNTILNEINSIPDSVSIHVRRGDYLKPEILKYHGVLPLSYYLKSIAHIESKISNAMYFIFSDDPEWCKENFTFIKDRYKIVDINNGGEAWKDMCLMTHCKHHIVANSSFSWWGAWLSKKVGYNLAPCKWFNPAFAQFNIDDFIPSEWHIIHYE